MYLSLLTSEAFK